MKNIYKYEIPLGYIEISDNGEKITALKMVDNCNNNGNIESELSKIAYKELMEYFMGNRKNFDIPFEIIGTKFQKMVWNELCNIPFGETRTYKEIAEKIGKPKAMRAVGGANNKNPIMIIIPCHRVIGSNGSLTGYSGGIEIKKALLEIENKFM